MDKLEVNGETWGRVMMGKQGDTPMYRQLIDGKMTPVKKALVPKNVIEAFEGYEVPMVAIGNGEEVPEQLQKYTEPIPEEVKAVADIIGDENIGGESKPANEFGFDGAEPEIDWKAAYEDAITHSTDNLTLKDLADLMYIKFGVYTCYLQREPKNDDIHPITGNMMTNFTRGQARQQYLSAVASKTNYDPNVMARILKSRESHFDMQAHREAHPDRFVQPDIEMPTEDNPYADKKLTMKEWRDMRASEKPIMNTEHGRRGDGTDEDELYAEPPINGRTIIRPYATNPIAERRLEEKRLKRERGY